MINNMMTDSRYRTYQGETGQKNINLTRLSGNKPESTYSVPSIDEITGESVMPSDTFLVPLIPAEKPEPATMKNPQFSQGYLQKHIGQRMRVEFLIGAGGTLIDRSGVLVNVGESFIVLQPTDTDDLLMCDLYSIKFVTIFK